MVGVRVQVVRCVDDSFPGFVECELFDAHGRRWVFVEKEELAVQAVKMREEDAKHTWPDGAPGMAASITHEFELSGGRKGFAHLAGFGPGGTGYMAAVPSPGGKYELVLSVTRAHEGSDQFRTTDDTMDYANKLQVGTNLLLEQAVRKLDAALFGEVSKTERR